MAITDIQISEELETNAPSIKYKGNEGPKSPQQIEQMMMQQMQEMDQIQNQEAGEEELMTAELDILREEYLKYVFEMEEQGLQPMSFREFLDQTIAEGQMSGGQPLPQDPTKPVNPFQPKPQGPVLPDRQMAAYGGIMGLDGRRKYGIGSFLKKTVRKIIPNEVADIAVKAAPFIAPFNPLAAAVAGGLGAFDQTGSISRGLKSGLMNYGLGQGARYLGGADFQGLQNPFTRDAFSMPTGSGGIKNLFKAKPEISGASGIDKRLMTDIENYQTAAGGLMETPAGETFVSKVVNPEKIIQEQSTSILGDLPKLIRDNLSKVGLGNNLVTGLLAGGLGASALMGNMTEEEISETMDRGGNLDIEGIRTEVLEAMKDPTGEALKAIRIKYPFLGTRRSKNLDAIGKAMGGRIGMADGGIMDLGGMEKDYRAEGGFVPIGKEEKADDVPARLSVNEFVFTADAVRNAGGGDIDKGAEVMENMMKNLEAGGQVSEESQGLAGAQQMFETSERLSEVI